MKRQLGISVLVGYYWLYAALFSFFGFLGLYLASSATRSIAYESFVGRAFMVFVSLGWSFLFATSYLLITPQQTTFAERIYIDPKLSVVMFIFATACWLIGFGLWRGSRIARWAAICVAYLYLIIELQLILLSIIVDLKYEFSGPVSMASWLLFALYQAPYIAFYIWSAWYLRRGPGRQFFVLGQQASV